MPRSCFPAWCATQLTAPFAWRGGAFCVINKKPVSAMETGFFVSFQKNRLKIVNLLFASTLKTIYLYNS